MSEKEFLSQLKANQGVIYKLVNLYATADEDKKDLYQEILFQAWKSFATFRGESKFSTWLYRLCLNTIFTLQRKKGRIDYTDVTNYEDSFISNETADDKERLYKAMRTLPETDRAIISMHLDGYDNKEIGNMIGITANSVGVKLFRAKQQLGILLKDTI